MFDTELVAEILNQILVAAYRIERRFVSIGRADDFLESNVGLDRLDAIAMMLITIGESLRNLEKRAGDTLLKRYPEVDWKGAKGLRNILSHNYFGVNAKAIFAICRDKIPGLIATIEKIQKELADGPS